MERIITFEKYLSKKTHQAKRHWEKNIVRYLIPFDLLDMIWCKYKTESKSNSFVLVDSNKYYYEIKECLSDSKCTKFTIHVHLSANKNDWNKMITIFDDFEIVFSNKDVFSTVYPLGNDCEQPIFETLKKQLLNHEFDKLAAYNSKNFNDFLAMLLIQSIAQNAKTKAKYSYPHLTVEPITKSIKLADSDNQRDQILYAFDKKDADKMVDEFTPDGKKDALLSKHYRHIVYFVNTDFETSGHKKKENVNAKSISIKAFMANLKIPHSEWIKYELAVLYLTYNNNQEILDWINPYAFSHFQTIIQENALNKKEDEPISDSLFQDALNTLNTTQHLNNSLDYFHFLCAANLVNRKYNDILRSLKDKSCAEYIDVNQKMIGFKYHIFNIFHTWIEKKLKCMKICFGHVVYPDGQISEDDSLFINMKIGVLKYQFRFRMKSKDKNQQKFLQNFMSFAKTEDIQFNGTDSGIYLQPIAQTLYQYSYLLKLGLK